MPKQKIYFIGTLISVLLLTSVARAEVSEETAYILNTFLFLVLSLTKIYIPLDIIKTRPSQIHLLGKSPKK